MLTVAEDIEPGVTWTEADAGRLPFDDDEFDAVADPGQLGSHRTTGIDLNKPRMRAVLDAVVALSVLPHGFAASDVANKVREILDLSSSDYLPRHASYDLRKLRGKQWLHRIGNSRR